MRVRVPLSAQERDSRKEGINTKMSRKEWLTFVSDICVVVCVCVAVGLLTGKFILYAVVGIVGGVLLGLGLKKYRDRKAAGKQDEKKPEDQETDKENE